MISHEKFSVLVKERSGLFLCLLLGPGRGPRGSPAEHERLADAVALSGELEQASVDWQRRVGQVLRGRVLVV